MRSSRSLQRLKLRVLATGEPLAGGRIHQGVVATAEDLTAGGVTLGRAKQRWFACSSRLARNLAHRMRSALGSESAPCILRSDRVGRRNTDV